MPNQVDIRPGVLGNFNINNFNSGSNAGSSTFWRGDGTWQTVTGGGGGAVSGPGSTTVGHLATWNNTSGTLLADTAPATLSTANDTNVQIAATGNPSTALVNACTLTMSWTGTLSPARGGTGLGSYTIGDILYASGSGTLAALNDVATGNALISGGVATAPSWGKINLATTVSGNLPVTNLNSGTSASSSTFWRGDGTWSAAGGTILPGYISGLTLSNDGVAPTTTLDIASGLATDSTGAVYITLGAFTKKTGGSWVAGTGNNGMGTGLTVANSTWYHVFAIINGGNADVYFDTSVTAANAPASTTAFRRIGSFKTDGSAHIIAFVQNGQVFNWTAGVLDVNGTTSSLSGQTVTLTVPPGVAVEALLGAQIAGGGSANQQIQISAIGTTAPIATVCGNTSTADSYGGWIATFTNTSQQIKVLGVNSTAAYYIGTFGWRDPLGAGVITTLPVVNLNNLVPPGGRLTLQTGTPVQTADQTAKSTVYYDSYISGQVPVYNGTAWVSLTITGDEISMGLDAVTPHVASGSAYDIWAINNSSSLVIAVGPAWSSTTSRGTGAGTTELQRLNGIWTNKNSLTHAWGGASGTTDYGAVSANQATYLGTLYATANGQTGVALTPAAASGGTNNIIGLFNAYNRVRATAQCQDNQASYNYSTTTWRAAAGSNSNRITWMDGLQTISPLADYQIFSQSTSIGDATVNGITLDSTSNTPPVACRCQFDTVNRGRTSFVQAGFYAQLGLHFLSAMEAAAIAAGTIAWGTSTTGPNQQIANLNVQLEI